MDKLTELKIRNLIAEKEHNTASGVNDIEMRGSWMCDHDAYNREISEKIDTLISTAEVVKVGMNDVELMALATLVQTEIAEVTAANDYRKHQGNAPAYDCVCGATIDALHAELKRRAII